MQSTFICQNCREEKFFNPRFKGHQSYCGDPLCQRARKRLWQKEKIAADEAYRNRQSACLRQWRKKRPLHEYQKNYRESHPEYVEKNRQQQTIRNRRGAKKAQSAAPKKIVKMDRLESSLIKSGTYVITPLNIEASEKIVKMDALIVELQVFHEDTPSFSAPIP
jgi:hypothetical protein